MKRLAVPFNTALDVTLLSLPAISDGAQQVEAEVVLGAHHDVTALPEGTEHFSMLLNACPIDTLTQCHIGTVLHVQTFPLSKGFISFDIVSA